MWVALAKIAVQFLPKDKLIHILIFVPLALVVCIGLVFAGPGAIQKHVPLATDDQYYYYIRAAEQIQSETGILISWQQIIAIDAVLFQQDFTAATQQRAYSYKPYFIREDTVETACPSPQPTPTPKATPKVTPKPTPAPPAAKCYKTVYNARAYDDVLQLLVNNGTITADQIQDIQDYNKFTLSMNEFGDDENLGGINIGGDLVIKEGIFLWPLPAANTRITSAFSTRIHPITGIKSSHKGIDIAAVIGTNVYAIEDGYVTRSSYLGTGGETIHIQHAGKMVSKYLHLSGYAVTVGTSVKKGDIIGYSGNTGGSTGPHLHLQIEYNDVPVDPLRFY